MNLVLHEKDRTAETEKGLARLTRKEFGILSYLAKNDGKIIPAEEIYRNVWNAEPFDCHLVISVHIRHIREKIEKDPSRPEYIRVFWGKGYCCCSQPG